MIRCRRSRFEERGKTDVQVIAQLARRLHLDAAKVAHLVTFKQARRVHILVDYDNPTHQRCPVRSFRGTTLKDMRIPDSAVEYVHGTVEFWNREIATKGGRYPVQLGDHVELPPGRSRKGGGDSALEARPGPDEPGSGDDDEDDEDDDDGTAHPSTTTPSSSPDRKEVVARAVT
jgi:hypothetical protein